MKVTINSKNNKILTEFQDNAGDLEENLRKKINKTKVFNTAIILDYK